MSRVKGFAGEGCEVASEKRENTRVTQGLFLHRGFPVQTRGELKTQKTHVARGLHKMIQK